MPERSTVVASSGNGTSASPGKAGPDVDWPAQAADSIVDIVGKVADATTGKAVSTARWVVYGVLAGILGAAIAVLMAIAVVRLLDAYLPSSLFGDSHVWAAHLLTGLLFTVMGALLWRKRRPPEPAR